MARKIELQLHKTNGKLSSKALWPIEVYNTVINFFVKYFFLIPLVKALDHYNRCSDRDREIAAGYLRCYREAEFLDRMDQYNTAYRKFTFSGNCYAAKATFVANLINKSERIKKYNGYGVLPKYKPKHPRGL